MEMILTGNPITAQEAERAGALVSAGFIALLSFFKGLVSKVFPVDQVVAEAVKTAEQISKLSLPVVQMCKEAVNTGESGGLDCV